MSDQVGRQLRDDRNDGPIGAGGMGEAHLAEHVHLLRFRGFRLAPEARQPFGLLAGYSFRGPEEPRRVELPEMRSSGGA